jgi:phosphoribosylformylglycinamidine (FGAM) synthase-like enzyme
VIAIQDMGAAGLTCSAVEMGAKGGLGIRLDLDKVPVREDGMTAYEMMLSESQERMLMVLRPEKEAEARAVFEKWDLDFAVVTPGLGAGIVRVHGTDKALAFTSDVTPRYVRANPVEGGKQAVAEAFRNLCAVGAKPLATTDNLNFGNPEKPEIMGQFVGAIKGIGEACIALDMPIVSGNVSLYNETDGQAILPTPTIGAVGLLDDLDGMIAGTIRDGHVLLLVGETRGHLGQSALLYEVFNREDGDAPPVDLAAERRNGDFIRENAGWINACSDLSDGGLALAAFEMAVAGGVGLTLDAADTATLFGEDQGRYLIATSFDKAEALMVAAGQAGVPLVTVGRVGGDAMRIGAASAPMAELRESWATAFAEHFG